VRREEIQARRHHLSVRLPAEGIKLQADHEGLVQVLCNLLGNAAKYTPVGGAQDAGPTLRSQRA
jgi:signal transduction histidine kinase